MGIFSISFIVVFILVVGFAWARLRTNWRSVQSMRGGSKVPIDHSIIDGAGLPDGSHHPGQGHDGSVHHGDSSGPHSGGFDSGDHGGFDGGHSDFGGGGHH